MPSTKDLQIGSLIQALVYGRPKVGKTFGALTAPRPNVIDFDRGIAVARNPTFIQKYGLKDILYEQFYEKTLSPRGVPTQHNAFDDACRYFDQWMAPGKRDQFDTWVVDSGTSLVKAASNKGIILLGGKSLGITSQTHSAAVQTGVIYPKKQDFGVERSMTEQFIRMVKDSGKHVFFICHERTVTNDQGEVESIHPLLTGGSVDAIGAMFDEVWNIQVYGAPPNTSHVMITQPIGRRVVGSRTGMPNETPFNWESIQKAHQEIIKAQEAMNAAIKQ